MKSDDDGALILSDVERHIGSLSAGQRTRTLEAISECADGVLALAKRIASKANVHSPAAVFMAGIDRGEHLPRRAVGRHHSPLPLSGSPQHRAWAEQLYEVKLADIAKHDTGWTQDEQRQHAIDYALDYCKASGSELWAIEAALRSRHGVQLSGRERDFERDTDHRRLMVETHAQPLGSATYAAARALEGR